MNSFCLIDNINPIEKYYSFTICSDYNFMSHEDFNVINTKTDFQIDQNLLQCVSNIHYVFLSGNITDKYCLWCPILSSGSQYDYR